MLADLVGIPIDDADVPEVANRFSSLMPTRPGYMCQ